MAAERGKENEHRHDTASNIASQPADSERAVLASRIDEAKQGLLPSPTTAADLCRIADNHPLRTAHALAVAIEVLAIRALKEAEGTPHEAAVRGPINRIVEACLEIRSSSPRDATPANRADKLDVVQPHREGRP